MARAARWQDRFSFGGRIPWSVGLVLCITVALSLAVAFGDRHAGGLFALLSLVPQDVWHGQVWRLLSWPFIEPGPIGLIFACLFLYWFGRDLAQEWGDRRWLSVFGGVAGVAAVGTCLVAQVDPPVMDYAYLGGWALTSAMVVAWGLWFPHRIVRIYFIIPITGFWLAWLTVAVTVVFAVYSGWEGYLPELFAEASILAWLYRRLLAAKWTRARRDLDLQRQRAERSRRRSKAASHLRLIESQDDDGDAPLPPELEDQVRDLLSKARPARDKKDEN
jgi:membrane associated rhomboid family serine protease